MPTRKIVIAITISFVLIAVIFAFLNNWIVTTIFSGLSICLLKFIWNYSENWGLLLNYLLTLISTFTGVYLAVAYGDQSMKADRLEKVNKLLDMTFQASADYVGRMEGVEQFVDDSSQTRSLLKNSRHYFSDPIGISNLISSNELVINGFSVQTVYQLRTHYYNFITSLNTLDNYIYGTSSFSESKFAISNLKYWMTRINRQFHWEKELQNKIIDSDDMNDSVVLYNKYLEEYFRKNLVTPPR